MLRKLWNLFLQLMRRVYYPVPPERGVLPQKTINYFYNILIIPTQEKIILLDRSIILSPQIPDPCCFHHRRTPGRFLGIDGRFPAIQLFPDSSTGASNRKRKRIFFPVILSPVYNMKTLNSAIQNMEPEGIDLKTEKTENGLKVTVSQLGLHSMVVAERNR